jgi:hypothetical protein
LNSYNWNNKIRNRCIWLSNFSGNKKIGSGDPKISSGIAKRQTLKEIFNISSLNWKLINNQLSIVVPGENLAKPE